METPGEFYVHLKGEEDDLQAMALQLNELCSKDSGGVDKKKLKEGKCGITVATQNVHRKINVLTCPILSGMSALYIVKAESVLFGEVS